MVCSKCRYVNRAGAGVCKYCGAPLGEPRAVRVEIPTVKIKTEEKKQPLEVKKQPYKDRPVKPAVSSVKIETSTIDEDNGERDNSGKFIAILVALCVLVIAGFAVFAVLLFSKTGKSVPASATSTPTPTATEAAPSPSPSASPSSTQIPTTTPVPTEDISSIFTRPSDTITAD